MKTYFTFGSGHHMGKPGTPEYRSLSNCYTIIEAKTRGDARAMLTHARGGKSIWAFDYATPEEAGVDRFNLTLVPFSSILPQHGPTA